MGHPVLEVFKPPVALEEMHRVLRAGDEQFDCGKLPYAELAAELLVIFTVDLADLHVFTSLWLLFKVTEQLAEINKC